MKKILNLLLLSLVCLTATPSFASSRLCKVVESNLIEGDLVFIALGNPIFKKVAEGTQSWASHVGIAFKDHQKGWLIWESTFPLSKKTKLCEYVKRADKSQLEIKRTKTPLTKVDIVALKSSVNKMMNLRYNQGFELDEPNSTFCSKLVFLAFLEVGFEIGSIQTFQDLLDANPDFDISFFKMWYLGNIPWDRKTVTPAAQLEDSDLYSVFKTSFLE